MNGILTAICVLLIAGAFLLLVWIFSDLVKAKGGKIFSRDQLQAFNALLLPGCMIGGFALLLWYVLKFAGPWLPPLASVHGKKTDQMFWTTLGITGFVFIGTQVLLFSFAFIYRNRKSRRAFFFTGNNKLEAAWTLIPFITFIALFYWAHISWKKIKSTPEKEVVNIEIMAEQFNWRLRYAGPDKQLGAYDFKWMNEVNNSGINFNDTTSFDDFTPVQFHIPKGIPIELHIRSRDVIHSVFMPNFRVKMDAVPGMHTSFKFTANVTTDEMREQTGNPDFNFELACAELCGRMHFAMLMIIVVDEEAQFDAWYKKQKPWLHEHPEYLARLPENLRNIAGRKSREALATTIINPIDSKLP